MPGTGHPTLLQMLSECMASDRARLRERARKLDALSRPADKENELARLLHQINLSRKERENRARLVPRISYPPQLPVSARKDDILAAIREHQVVVIAGETGSGKTTQLPKICLEAGLGLSGKIGCTQPRRVAALAIARRLAEELNVTLGREVGSKIRFSDVSSKETLIKVMTDGILLAELQGDPDLLEYEAILIDEAHERSLNIDFLLGHLKRLLQKRPDLKLIITSATIDTQSFSEAFGQAPVLEVSGRVYPVEVRYAPLETSAVESGEVTYIDAAVEAVSGLIDESSAGDLLVFMPGERDIRETCDLLRGRFQPCEIIPLFGRLSAAEQQRVFSPSGRRKIIVATNIAETSLTLPGIRYVVDAGLARLSRYNPRTRTRRLPIEPISQSSAEQRRGRSGRVQNGICVRLYSEEDHLERPRFTQPEIQRANLAEVILRMKAFRLGEIETFPFLNPPHPGAIQSGYKVLQELGALNEQRDLTPLGAELARLPVDPVVGRMILEARKEKAVHEVAVIAAALSIQDPRERPLDRAFTADEAHRKFVDPYSDFLTLLNIWDEYHAQWEALKTQNQLRKFCQSHFLSYMRMREWRDVHAQIMAILEEDNRFQENAAPAPYEAIHRSILSGLLGQVAQRKERNLYQAGGGRLVRIFPGSGLFAKNGHEKKKNPNPDEPSSSQPEWLMSAEIVETSQLFARTVAWIEPLWIAEIGSHLCRSTFHEAHWRASAGRVVVLEKVMLHGLTVLERWIDYGKVDPVKATELFIRALVEDQVQMPHKFLAHNQQVRQRLEVWQTRMRQAAHCDLDQAFFNFYQQRLRHISSIHDLNKLLRDKLMHDPQFLCASEEELTGQAAVALDREAYPAQVKLANQTVEVSYAYAPGEEQDGVTLRLPVEIARAIAPEEIRWLVPGLREEQVLHLLRSLPKALRIKLMPLDRAAAEIARELGHQISPAQLSEFLAKRRQVHVPEAAWQFDSLPLHLQTRIEITRGKSGKVLAAGRELKLLQQQLKNEECSIEQELWRQAARQWERYELRGWTLGDVPEKVRVGQLNDVEVWGFPGLHLENEQVNLRLFRRKEEALLASRKGFPRLLEFGLQREFAWIEKDLRGLDKLKELFVTLGPADLLRASALAHLRRLLFQFPAEPFELKQTIYEQALESARRKIPGLIPRLLEQIENILRARQEVLLCRKPLPEMRRHLDSLVPPSFLESTPPERLPHLPRYLKALLLRAERAAINPLKDREKQALIEPFSEALNKLQKTSATGDSRRKAGQFRWLLEEYKVSVFAQELGTSQPVSQKRLQSLLPSNG